MRFGHIPGYPEGFEFKNRKEIKLAGLHNHQMYGISRVVGVGVDCVVLSGGYEDDEDFGDEIIFAGEGGRENVGSKVHTHDQELIRGNLDLSRNKYSKYPIRVIRGSKLIDSEYSPALNYRYDGLYYLEDYWAQKGKHGFRVWKYRLVKIDGLSIPKKDESKSTTRTLISSNRIDRDSSIPRDLKKMYNHQCQVCGIRLEANGNPYAVGAHIKGLGKPHNGPDLKENMLVLCPNDHYLFDAFAFSINDDLSLLGYDLELTNNNTNKLITVKKHKINLDYIKYHRINYNIAKNI